MTKVLTAVQMRQVEQECAKIGLPTGRLMENAGRAVAEEIRDTLDAIYHHSILILIGPGNNGGDGLVAARHLYDWGAGVGLYIFGKREDDDPNLQLVKEDILAVLEVARRGKVMLKVIIETCNLTDEEKVQVCKIILDAGCDFVKTSTGFGDYGAKVEDVQLLRKIAGKSMGVKAAGGIRTYEDAVKMINAGASRLGASSGIRIREGCPD